MEPLGELLVFVEKVLTFFTSPSAALKMEIGQRGMSMVNALRCLQYRDGLLQGLQRLRAEECLSDITIKVDDKVFHAHRCVLAAVSAYFEVMFSHGFEESEKSEIEIKDIDGDIFEVLLNFAYSGRMETVSLETAVDAFKGAVYLQFPLAQTACTDFMSKLVKAETISPKDALTIWAVAEEYGKPDLSETCYHYLAKTEHFLQVMGTDTFMEKAPAELIDRFLKQIDIPSDTNEEEMLSCIIGWLKHDWESRKEYAADFLRGFRLGLVPEDKVKELMDAEILELPECKEILDDLEQKREKFAGEDDFARLPEVFLPRNFTRTLLCIGGQGQVPNLVSFFNKEIQSWSQLENFPKIPCRWSPFLLFPELCYHAALVVDGDIYVGGGRVRGEEPSPDDNRFLKFDGRNYRWQQLPRMRTDRVAFKLVHLDDFIYAVGGFGCERTLDTVERFNLTSQEWDNVYTMPEAVTCPSTVVFNGKILVHGMKDAILGASSQSRNANATIVYALMAFDPATQEWSKLLEERLPAPDEDPAVTCVLVVQDGACYRVWYEESQLEGPDHETILIPHVNQINTKILRNGVLRARVGEEVGNQDAIPRNEANAFHVNGHVYINMSRYIHKTGLTIAEDKELNLERWNDCGYGSLGVVEFTVDLNKETSTE